MLQREKPMALLFRTTMSFCPMSKILNDIIYFLNGHLSKSTSFHVEILPILPLI